MHQPNQAGVPGIFFQGETFQGVFVEFDKLTLDRLRVGTFSIRPSFLDPTNRSHSDPGRNHLPLHAHLSLTWNFTFPHLGTRPSYARSGSCFLQPLDEVELFISRQPNFLKGRDFARGLSGASTAN